MREDKEANFQTSVCIFLYGLPLAARRPSGSQLSGSNAIRLSLSEHTWKPPPEMELEAGASPAPSNFSFFWAREPLERAEKEKK